MRISWKLIKTILVFLAFLELYLWVGTFLTQSEQSFSNAFQASKKGVYRIMCIGESLTLVGGNDSYPSQLEAILNKSASDGRQYQVLNEGRPGATSTVVADHLPFWLDQYKPNMVIVMTGIIDNDKFKEAQQNQGQPLFPFLNKIKIIQLYQHMSQKAVAGLNDFTVREKWSAPKKEKPIIGEFELFMKALAVQSDEQKKIYIYIALAEGQKRYDIADYLYQKFLQNNDNPLIEHWMLKRYGNTLNIMGAYDKFVHLMDHIDYDSWYSNWVKGYCTSQDHMDYVAQKIEKMVKVDGVSKEVYGWAESCYNQGGRNDLALVYHDKMKLANSTYQYPETRRNYFKIKKMLLDQGVQPVFLQYPNRDLEPLLDIFKDDPDKKKILFVDNGPIFAEGIVQNGYDHYFIDRMSGDVGHATREGNRLLASNVARAIETYLKNE